MGVDEGTKAPSFLLYDTACSVDRDDHCFRVLNHVKLGSICNETVKCVKHDKNFSKGVTQHMFSFITDREWKAVWTAVTLASFAVMFALNFLFGSPGGLVWWSMIKIFLLALQFGGITAYLFRKNLKKALVSFWITVLCLGLLSLIAPVLAPFAKVVMNTEDTSFEMATPLFLLLTGVTASWLIPGPKGRMAVRILWAVFVLLYCLIQFTYIGYFGLTHALISVNMMLALAQTNLHEALEYISVNIPLLNLVLAVAALFALSYVIFRVSGYFFVGPRDVSGRTKKGVVLILIFEVAALIFCFSQTRIAQTVAQTQDTVKSFIEYQHMVEERRHNVINNKHLSNKLKHAPDGVYVLIIGESETRDHMGVYGYPRDNTPFETEAAENKDYTFFTHAYSSYTQTVQSLTYALTQKNQYNKIPLVDAYSIIDMARAAGFRTTWISNQSRFGIWDTPIGAIGSACDDQHWMNDYIGTGVQTKDYDSILVPQLQKVDPNNRRQLIVIHLMGSHVSYWDRYPHAGFYKYPLDQSKTRSKDQVMIDEYDNSVLYTDHVLSEIMNVAINHLHADEVMYFSDHGELVTQNPGHNADQFEFQMVHIPFWIYTSPEYQKKHPAEFAAMKRRKNWLFTNDMAYDTLMGSMGLTSVKYDPTCDFFSRKYDKDITNMMTMYGNIWLREDVKALGTNYKNQ